MSGPGRILALDWGKRRIGLAVCDELGLTVRGLETLIRSNREADLAALEAVAREQEARALVVGRPLELDGAVGKSARQAEQFARTLARRLALPLELHDERLTSREAESILQQRGRRYAKAEIDSVAATLILESYLASCPEGAA